MKQVVLNDLPDIYVEDAYIKDYMDNPDAHD